MDQISVDQEFVIIVALLGDVFMTGMQIVAVEGGWKD